MATIEIDDKIVPEGWELTGEYRAPKDEEWVLTGEVSGFPVMAQNFGKMYQAMYPIIRRKPRLAKIVFTIAGERREIATGEWFISDCGDIICNTYDFLQLAKRIPLIREEVWE